MRVGVGRLVSGNHEAAGTEGAEGGQIARRPDLNLPDDATLTQVLDTIDGLGFNPCDFRDVLPEATESDEIDPVMCGVLDGDDVAVPSVEQIVATMAQQFQTLPLASSGITHQPDGDWAMVNIDFIVMTDPSPQTLTTTLLGVGVAVRATPVHYSWDFGDGSPPKPTSDPGQPYPGQTVTHVYSSASDAVAVTLTTQWRGELQIGG